MHLTEKEVSVLSNSEFLTVKAEISSKINASLSDIHSELKQVAKNTPSEVLKYFTKPGKISRGENYNSLPYFVLDYPNHFKKDEVFAIRHLVWWGNFLSCTLHISGNLKKNLENQLLLFKEFYDQEEFFICVNTTPWEYHYKSSNYLKINDLSNTDFQKILEEQTFIKLSIKAPIDAINDLKPFYKKIFLHFISLFK